MARFIFTICALLISNAAFSQDGGMECDTYIPRGPIEVTPATSASQVTLDAWVKVLYSPGYFSIDGGDPERDFELRRCAALSIFECETEGERVAGETQVVGDTLYFLPSRNFASNEVYVGVARGIDLDLRINFRTSMSIDRSPPRLGSVGEPTTTRLDPGCDAPEGGYRMDVSFVPAVDDGSPGSIEYLLYLSRGAGLEAPELRSKARNFSTTGEIPMALVLSHEEAASPACIVIHAIDGVGNIDDDMSPLCFEPIQGNFFEPACAVGSGGHVFWWIMILVILRRKGDCAL